MLGNELSTIEGNMEWIGLGPAVVDETEGTPLVSRLGDADPKNVGTGLGICVGSSVKTLLGRMEALAEGNIL